MNKPLNPTRSKANSTPQPNEPTAKLPHERDESGDNVGAKPQAVIQQAKADIDSGKRQTDRGEATDAAYQRQKDSQPPKG